MEKRVQGSLSRAVSVLFQVAVLVASCGVALFLWRAIPQGVRSLNALLFDLQPFSMPDWMEALLLVYFGLFIFGSVFPFLLLFGWSLLYSPERGDRGAVPFVSVVIPAYNEQEHIGRSLQAALQLDYPHYEIIVVDDGSTDFTLPSIENASVYCVKLRSNRGKAAALNEGVARAKGSIVVFSDSDSWLHPQSLRHLVRHFSDASVGAVAGTVMVHGQRKLLTCWQNIEYILGQAVVKTAQMGCGRSTIICPGPICAYRRDFLAAMGGFTDRTLTEDFDATLGVIDRRYRVVYEPRAQAMTDAPSSWKALRSQRRRWYRGNLQVLLAYRKLLFARRAGWVGLFWLPVHVVLVGYGMALVEVLLLSAFPVILLCCQCPGELLRNAVLYLVLVECFSLLQYVVALIKVRQIRWKLVLCAAIILPFRFVVSITRLGAIVGEVLGTRRSWERS
ncbi:MAG: glycosyltransferase family 2 protein [Bradymonadales bacterium]|nr:glycosyltransferase family 2 protein [Bradymonadales bacterium]